MDVRNSVRVSCYEKDAVSQDNGYLTINSIQETSVYQVFNIPTNNIQSATNLAELSRIVPNITKVIVDVKDEKGFTKSTHYGVISKIIDYQITPTGTIRYFRVNIKLMDRYSSQVNDYPEMCDLIHNIFAYGHFLVCEIVGNYTNKEDLDRVYNRFQEFTYNRRTYLFREYLHKSKAFRPDPNRIDAVPYSVGLILFFTDEPIYNVDEYITFKRVAKQYLVSRLVVDASTDDNTTPDIN